MITFPNCKINLGLHLVAKRKDGYHDIETVFYPVPFFDLLEIIPGAPTEKIVLQQTGLPIEGKADQNLCIKAYHLLKKDFASLPPLTIYLHKQIPAGAGLGGGSADGSFMLRMLVQQFQLPVRPEQLKEYALRLGSDCPFFIDNKPVLARGRGEKMYPIDLNLKGWYLVLILTGLHVSTREAFEGSIPHLPDMPLEKCIQRPVEEWRQCLINQFEETVFLRFPVLALQKKLLYQQGASYASMTGTGSTLYGLFTSLPDLEALGKKSGHKISCFQLA